MVIQYLPKEMARKAMSNNKPKVTANDRVGELWYAPAGPNRGTFTYTSIIYTSNDNNPLGLMFVDEMPSGICSSSHGYLLYDVNTELYAGVLQAWWSRVRNIFLEEDVIFCDDVNKTRFRNSSVLNTVDSGSEVLLVPCKSYESKIDEDLFIYQEFNWKWAMVLKSRSGRLPVMP